MNRLLLILALALVLTGCADSQPPETTTPVAATNAAIPAETEANAIPAAPQTVLPAVPSVEGDPVPLTIADTAPGMTAAQSAYYSSLNRDSEALLAFDAFLNGNIKCFDVDAAQAMGLNSLLQYWSVNDPAQVSKLTLVDLDADGTPELLLWIATDNDPYAGYEILRWDGGNLVAYGAAYRNFDQLKTDGTWKINAQDGSFGYGNVVFDGQNCTAYIRHTDSATHEAKADAYWFADWQSFYYPGTRKVSDVIRGVLEGETYITDTLSGNAYPLTKAGQILVPEEVPSYIEQYAMVDMDDDGQEELILAISGGNGFVIVNAANNTVYGDAAFYRAFQDLKTDGTYMGSGGASSTYYYRRAFDGQHWVETTLAETYETLVNGSYQQVYYVGGKLTTEKVFAEFEKAQQAKKNVQWYDSWEACLEAS